MDTSNIGKVRAPDLTADDDDHPSVLFQNVAILWPMWPYVAVNSDQ